MKFRNKIVVGVAIYLVIFTQEVLLLSYLGHPEPAVLIGCVFGAGFGEWGLVAWVTNVKNKRKKEAGDQYEGG